MSNSINLNLPYLLSNQAQKHVTHNEALKMLDVLVQLSVVDNTLSAPPQSPSEGDSYTIATSPTGVWAGKENQVTIWHDGAWSFYSPNKGWITWVESNNTLQVYNGTDWVDISGVLSASTAPILGINAVADTTNRLSINSAAILFNKEVDDVQVKLNKQASTDTASFLFQTNFSGRAEIGATGDDDFHFKVSSDGTIWNEGIIIDSDTGEVSFPNTTLAASSSSGSIDDLVARIFSRVSPTQWGFCHVVSEAYTDIAKTTKAIAVDDVVAVIEDKSPNNIDLVAGGTDAVNKIKLRLDPATVGVDEAHLTTHFLKVTVPTGGFEGKLIMAYRSGCYIDYVDVPAGDWKIWSGTGAGIRSGFIGAFAVENIGNLDIDEVIRAFYSLGAGSKPANSAISIFYQRDAYYRAPDLSFIDFSRITSLASGFRGSPFKKITLKGDNFEELTSIEDVFRDCNELRQLDVTHWNTSKVNNARLAFYNCSEIRELNVAFWDVSGLTNANSMFKLCKKLEYLDTEDWRVPNLLYAANMFASCDKLKSLHMSEWNSSSLADMSSMFHSCFELAEIDITDLDVSNVIAASYMFYKCKKLKQIDISGWDLSSLTDMNRAFLYCYELEEVNVGTAFDYSPCTNYTNIFYDNKLDQQSVDDILVSINNAATSNGTLNIVGANTAAPSSVGVAAKTALQGRGWTVTTQ